MDEHDCSYFESELSLHIRFFSAECKESRGKFFTGFLTKIELFGGSGAPWAPLGRIPAPGVDFRRFFGGILETFGAHWPSFGLQGGPTLDIFRPLGHHFAASGRHGRQHAVRTLSLASPGDENVRFLGDPDVAYI